MPNSRRIGKIIGSDWATHFETPQSGGNDSDVKKLDPYELKPRDVERRFFDGEELLQTQNRKGFLHRIVTGDEKWVHYENP